MPDTLTAAVLPAVTEEQLAALCALWQGEGRSFWIMLHGGSMGPTILPGTRLHLRCRRGIPAIGSIVAYRQGRILVVHRLIGMTGSPEDPQIVCLGDGNILADPPVSADLVVGTVSTLSHQSLAGRVAFALRHPRRHARYLFRHLRQNNRRRGKAWNEATANRQDLNIL